MASAWSEPMRSGGFRARYRDPEGRKQTVKDELGDPITYRTATEAKDAAIDEWSKARRRYAPNPSRIPPTIPWGEFWDNYVSVRREFISSTPRTEGWAANKLVRPMWGDTPINRITHNRYKNWLLYELPAQGVSLDYQHRAHSIMGVSMSYAVTNEILTANPCRNIRLPKRQIKPQAIMESAELDEYRSHAREDYQDFLDFGYETGLRPGEQCGLHIKRIDKRARILHVKEVLLDRPFGIRNRPKISERLVPLTATAMGIAEKRMEDRTGETCGVRHLDNSECPGPLLFLTKRGRPFRPDTVRVYLRNLSGRKQMQYRHPYSMRRAFVTWALEGGVDPHTVQSITGHATPAMLQRYFQLTSRAVPRLEAARLLFGATLGQPPVNTGPEMSTDEAISVLVNKLFGRE